MPAGVAVDGISFTDLALVDRPDHAAVLGRIFTSWSLIEASVASLLGLMMHADHRAALAIMGTYRTNSNRVQAVRKVGKEMLDETLHPGFDTLMKDVLAYAEERNAIAHNLWGAKDDEPDIVYRMPMAAIPNFVIETTHKAACNAEGVIASIKGQIAAFTVADLERLEERGRHVLKRVMTETTQKGYARAVKNPGSR